MPGRLATEACGPWFVNRFVDDERSCSGWNDGARQAPRDHLRWLNANARHRDVLAAERKERTRIRSE